MTLTSLAENYSQYPFSAQLNWEALDVSLVNEGDFQLGIVGVSGGFNTVLQDTL